MAFVLVINFEVRPSCNYILLHSGEIRNSTSKVEIRVRFIHATEFALLSWHSKSRKSDVGCWMLDAFVKLL